MLIDRRTFIGLLSGAALGSSLALGAPLRAARTPAVPRKSVRIVPSTCDHDCGGRCLMQVHVRDGKVIHITTDDGTLSGASYGHHGPDRYQLRTCTRGRAYRDQVYSPPRILSPMKRVGARGEGRFAAISWNEALSTVARRMRTMKQQHGPASIFCGTGAGTASALNSAFDLQMLLARFGGFSGGWSQPSWEGAHFAMEYTLGLNDEHGPGAYADGADGADFLASRLILMWGWNPAHTHFGTTTKYHLQRAREAGIPMVCVDPVYTETAALWGSEWIPIKPGADAAVLMAMAFVILDEGLVDAEFVARFTDGAAEYREHLRGKNDGVHKDPRWASALSDIPAAKIVDLARRYATTNPANLVAGYAPGRTAFGEQYHRAAIALQALTGNVGRPGGGASGHRVSQPLRYSTVVHSWWERFRRDVEIHDTDIAMLKTTHLADAILEGKGVVPAQIGCHKALPADIRMLYSCAWNPLNQLPNVNHTEAALRKLDFIVVQDQRMTPTARYADILLPACTMLERDDFTTPWRDCEPHLLPQAKAIEPLGQSRPDHWIFDQLARRLALEPLRLEKSPRVWLDHLLALDARAPFAELVKQAGLREARARPWVAFEQNISDPQSHPFQTPSGRIEIRSSVLAQMNFSETSYGRPVPALPSYLENDDGPNARSIYPLQLITTKAQHRCHSTFTGNPRLEELQVQDAWLNPRDAAPRRIADGQAVNVFNARGRIRVVARVTERIKPGVIMVHEGAWYRPDSDRTDLGGNPNVLTSQVASPGGAYAYNTARVDIALVP
jgi:anaerobic dimethyl sulfoxide reductase subunit A